MTKTETKPRTRIRFQVSKRTNMQIWKKILLNVGAVFFALVIGAIIIASIGKNPFKFYERIILGCFEKPKAIGLLIRTIIPLLITSLGISVAFKMKFWNIGAEGQFLIGSLCAFSVAIALGDKVPSFIGILLVLLAGALGAGVYGGMVAVFKALFNTNETLLTLMLNYIALYLVTALVQNRVPFYVQDANGIPAFKILSENLWLHQINIGKMTIDTSLFFAIGIMVLLWVYLRFTKQGYQISVVGDSPNTARYAGMKVNAIMIRTMFLSSALIGLAGALQLTGISASHTFSTGFTNNVGWDGIIVAWLAKLNPYAIGLVSFFIGILDRGTSIARMQLQISDAMGDVLQGIILFSVIAFDFFINYKISIRKDIIEPKEQNVEPIEDNKNDTVNEDEASKIEIVVDSDEDEADTMEELALIQAIENNSDAKEEI